MLTLRLRLVAVVGVAVVVAACTGGGAQPSPTPSPPTTISPSLDAPSPTPEATEPTATSSPNPSPTPSPTPTGPGAADVVALVDRALNTGVDPELDNAPEPPAELVAEIEAVTAADSPARDDLLGTLGNKFSPEVAFRGDVDVVALGDATVDGDQLVVDVCVSQDFDNIAEGPDAIQIEIEDTYRHHRATAIESDGGLLLTDWQLVGGDPVPGDACVPPSIEAELLATWQDFIDRYVAFSADPQDDQAREEFAEVLTRSTREALLGVEDVTRIDGIEVRPNVQMAGRGSGLVAWCQDPSQNPDSGVVRPDGSLAPLPEVHLQGEFTMNDRWQLSGFQSRLEAQQAEVPEEWERCFGD